MTRPRRMPYTERGIGRVRCHYPRCRRKGFAPVRIPADGTWRALCWIHHCEVIRLLLEWLDDRNVDRTMARYAADVIRTVHER